MLSRKSFLLLCWLEYERESAKRSITLTDASTITEYSNWRAYESSRELQMRHNNNNNKNVNEIHGEIFILITSRGKKSNKIPQKEIFYLNDGACERIQDVWRCVCEKTHRHSRYVWNIMDLVLRWNKYRRAK